MRLCLAPCLKQRNTRTPKINLVIVLKEIQKEKLLWSAQKKSLLNQNAVKVKNGLKLNKNEKPKLTIYFTFSIYHLRRVKESKITGMLSCVFNSTYSKLLHDVNYVLQERFYKNLCNMAIMSYKRCRKQTKKVTTHNIQQHVTKSAALYAQDGVLLENYLIFNILGRITNVTMLKPNIKINKLAMSSFDSKK